MNKIPTDGKQEQYLKDQKYMIGSLNYFTKANVITEEKRGLIKIL